MVYQSFIAKCSLKYRWPSWVVYDQNFCLELPISLIVYGPSPIRAFMLNHSQIKLSTLRIGIQSARVWIIHGELAPDTLINALNLQRLFGPITKVQEFVICSTSTMGTASTVKIATFAMCVAIVLTLIHSLLVGTKRKANSQWTCNKSILIPDKQ